MFTWTTDSASPIYQFSAGTHSHATQANRPAFNFSLRYRPSLAIETLVKAISEVEGVFSQPTPEVDTSGLNDGSLHLIVRYWTLPHLWLWRTKIRAVVAIKVACVRAEIKIPQPVPVTLCSRTLDPEWVLNFELGEGKSARVSEWEKSSFSPRTSSLLTSSPLTSSLNIHPLNPVHCCVAKSPSDFLLLTFQIKQKASQFPISAPANSILFFEPPLV